MKTRFVQTVFVIFFHLLCIARADMIVMTDGEKVEGRIVREDEEHYVLEVAVSETINDEKIIPKSDVRSVEREAPDVTAFRKLEGLVPAPELLDVAEYEGRIERLEAFLAAYPESGKAESAREMLDVLESELEVVRQGGIKLGDEMIEEQVYEANAYEFDARITAKKINDAINRRDFLSALRLFTAFEGKFADSSSREDLVGKIKQVLTAFGTTLDANLESFDSRVERRQLGLERMSGEDRAQTKRALEEEMERLDARFDREKSDGTWVTPDAYHKGSLEEARRQVEKEMSRLESKVAEKETDVSLEKLYRTTWEELGRGTDEEKQELIRQVGSQGMPEFYLEKLKERAEPPEDQ